MGHRTGNETYMKSLLLVLTLLFSACTTPEEVTLIRVIDGDTIVVSINGQTDTIRYIDIDAPEMDEPRGPAARAANQNLLAGRITISPRGRDKYDRLLAYVYVNGRSLGAILILQGHARAWR